MVRIGAGISEHADTRLGAIDAAQQARAALGGAHADLAFAFAAGAHLRAPASTLAGVHEALAPTRLAGCAAGGVLAEGREIEAGTAIAVWAAALGDGCADVVHLCGCPDEPLEGLPPLADASGVVLLGDPLSFPADAGLALLAEHAPAVPVLGGLASGRGPDGSVPLFLDGEIVEEGGVAVVFRDVELLAAVSQGAAPIGPELTVTDADGPIIRELASVPALDKLREVLEGLPAHEQLLLADGMLLGMVVQPDQSEYRHGDFLVRSLLGADPETGAVAVGAPVSPGQIVRLHARDPRTADQDLRELLDLHRAALGGRSPAGALVFSCNGRGSDLFGVRDHDAQAVAARLCAPAAGFFAAGEIGPVAGQPFVHGLTATVAVFAG